MNNKTDYQNCVQKIHLLINWPLEEGYLAFDLPKGHGFVSSPLQSNLDLYNCIEEIAKLLPSLGNFIAQFNETIVSNNINVITDATGTMSVDAPASMSDQQLDIVSTRIGIIDRLVNTTGQSIDQQFRLAFSMKDSLKNDLTAHNKLLAQVEQFKSLNNSYKH